MPDELSRRAGKLVLILRVIDMVEMRLIKFMQSKQEKEGEKLVKDAGKPFADAYPTTGFGAGRLPWRAHIYGAASV